MTKDLLKGLNEHLKLEFRASHEYLAMSIWLAEHDLPGFATWMRKQSQRRDCCTRSASSITWSSAIRRWRCRRLRRRRCRGSPPRSCAPTSSKNEQDVTASINELYAMAEKAKDRPGVVMLQWFVTEQMEEEAAARAVLGRIRLAGNTGVGLLMIDQELAGGSVPGMPASPTDAGRVGPVFTSAGDDAPTVECGRRAVDRSGPSRQARIARLSRGKYVYEPGTVFPDHKHDVDKIDAVVSGRFRLVVRGHMKVLGPGDWIEIPRGTIHNAAVMGDEPVVSLDAVKL